MKLYRFLTGPDDASFCHRVTDALEATLAATVGDAEVILHQEPAGLDDDRLDHRIAETDGGREIR